MDEDCHDALTAYEIWYSGCCAESPADIGDVQPLHSATLPLNAGCGRQIKGTAGEFQAPCPADGCKEEGKEDPASAEDALIAGQQLNPFHGASKVPSPELARTPEMDEPIAESGVVEHVRTMMPSSLPEVSGCEMSRDVEALEQFESPLGYLQDKPFRLQRSARRRRVSSRSTDAALPVKHDAVDGGGLLHLTNLLVVLEQLEQVLRLNKSLERRCDFLRATRSLVKYQNDVLLSETKPRSRHLAARSMKRSASTCLPGLSFDVCDTAYLSSLGADASSSKKRHFVETGSGAGSTPGNGSGAVAGYGLGHDFVVIDGGTTGAGEKGLPACERKKSKKLQAKWEQVKKVFSGKTEAFPRKTEEDPVNAARNAWKPKNRKSKRFSTIVALNDVTIETLRSASTQGKDDGDLEREPSSPSSVKSEPTGTEAEGDIQFLSVNDGLEREGRKMERQRHSLDSAADVSPQSPREMKEEQAEKIDGGLKEDERFVFPDDSRTSPRAESAGSGSDALDDSSAGGIVRSISLKIPAAGESPSAGVHLGVAMSKSVPSSPITAPGQADEGQDEEVSQSHGVEPGGRARAAWGKVKDIIHTRRESFKLKAHRQGEGQSKGSGHPRSNGQHQDEGLQKGQGIQKVQGHQKDQSHPEDNCIDIGSKNKEEPEPYEVSKEPSTSLVTSTLTARSEGNALKEKRFRHPSTSPNRAAGFLTKRREKSSSPASRTEGRHEVQRQKTDSSVPRSSWLGTLPPSDDKSTKGPDETSTLRRTNTRKKSRIEFKTLGRAKSVDASVVKFTEDFINKMEEWEEKQKTASATGGATTSRTSRRSHVSESNSTDATTRSTPTGAPPEKVEQLSESFSRTVENWERVRGGRAKSREGRSDVRGKVEDNARSRSRERAKSAQRMEKELLKIEKKEQKLESELQKLTEMKQRLEGNARDGRSQEKTKDTNKVKEAEKIKDMDKVKDAENTKDTNRVKNVEKIRDSGEVKDAEKTKDTNRAKDVEKIRDSGEVKDAEKTKDTNRVKEAEIMDSAKVKDEGKINDTSNVRDVERIKSTEKFTVTDNAHDVERANDDEKAKDAEKVFDDVEKLACAQTVTDAEKAKDIEKIEDTEDTTVSEGKDTQKVCDYREVSDTKNVRKKKEEEKDEIKGDEKLNDSSKLTELEKVEDRDDVKVDDKKRVVSSEDVELGQVVGSTSTAFESIENGCHGNRPEVNSCSETEWAHLPETVLAGPFVYGAEDEGVKGRETGSFVNSDANKTGLQARLTDNERMRTDDDGETGADAVIEKLKEEIASKDERMASLDSAMEQLREQIAQLQHEKEQRSVAVPSQSLESAKVQTTPEAVSTALDLTQTHWPKKNEDSAITNIDTSHSANHSTNGTPENGKTISIDTAVNDSPNINTNTMAKTDIDTNTGGMNSGTSTIGSTTDSRTTMESNKTIIIPINTNTNSTDAILDSIPISSSIHISTNTSTDIDILPLQHPSTESAPTQSEPIAKALRFSTLAGHSVADKGRERRHSAEDDWSIRRTPSAFRPIFRSVRARREPQLPCLHQEASYTAPQTVRRFRPIVVGSNEGPNDQSPGVRQNEDLVANRFPVGSSPKASSTTNSVVESFSCTALEPQRDQETQRKIMTFTPPKIISLQQIGELRPRGVQNGKHSPRTHARNTSDTSFQPDWRSTDSKYRTLPHCHTFKTGKPHPLTLDKASSNSDGHSLRKKESPFQSPPSPLILRNLKTAAELMAESEKRRIRLRHSSEGPGGRSRTSSSDEETRHQSEMRTSQSAGWMTKKQEHSPIQTHHQRLVRNVGPHAPVGDGVPSPPPPAQPRTVSQHPFEPNSKKSNSSFEFGLVPTRTFVLCSIPPSKKIVPSLRSDSGEKVLVGSGNPATPTNSSKNKSSLSNNKSTAFCVTATSTDRSAKSVQGSNPVQKPQAVSVGVTDGKSATRDAASLRISDVQSPASRGHSGTDKSSERKEPEGSQTHKTKTKFLDGGWLIRSKKFFKSSK